MSREAMQMALHALEGWANYGKWHGSKVWPESALKQAKRNTTESIAALRQALETKQEPVAWMHNVIEGNVITHIPADIGRHPERWTALYKDPTPCKTCESLARAVMADQTYHEKVIPKREWVGLNHFDRTLLRTTYAPLKRLHHIKETKTNIVAEIVNDWDAFFTAIEAKLKEGNTYDREAMKQPEALRLADALDDEFAQGRISNHNGRKAAVELRRLYEVNQDLLKALNTILNISLIDNGHWAKREAHEAIAKATGGEV